jgi:hypothetical protein
MEVGGIGGLRLLEWGHQAAVSVPRSGAASQSETKDSRKGSGGKPALPFRDLILEDEMRMSADQPGDLGKGEGPAIVGLGKRDVLADRISGALDRAEAEGVADDLRKIGFLTVVAALVDLDGNGEKTAMLKEDLTGGTETAVVPLAGVVTRGEGVVALRVKTGIEAAEPLFPECLAIERIVHHVPPEVRRRRGSPTLGKRKRSPHPGRGGS